MIPEVFDGCGHKALAFSQRARVTVARAGMSADLPVPDGTRLDRVPAIINRLGVRIDLEQPDRRNIEEEIECDPQVVVRSHVH